MALASDASNRDFDGASNPDARLYVEFYINPIQNDFKTEQAGRPIFEDVTFVKIQVPGDNTFNVNTVAREDHKQRFPHHWAQFQNAHGADLQAIGTPLSQWAFLSKSVVEELKHQKYMTVEQIAGASDSQIGNLGMSAGHSPYDLRKRAIAYLASSETESEATARALEIQALKDQIAELTKLVSKPSETLHVKPKG